LYSELMESNYLLVSGVGSPASVEKVIGKSKVGRHLIFKDHHLYSEENADEIRMIGAAHTKILMTEKDAVKLRKFKLENAWVLQLSPKLDRNVMGLYESIINFVR
jgi:tetraacyldisaccharide-1-P 4'-kinase